MQNLDFQPQPLEPWAECPIASNEISAPAKITLTLLDAAGGGYGSRTSTTGRVEFPINVSSGVTVQTDLFCPAETATHRLVGVPKNAQGGLGTVSGNVLRATCTYELKPGQVLGSIRGFVTSEVRNPLDNVDVGTPLSDGSFVSHVTNSFGFYNLLQLPTPHGYTVTYSKQPTSADLSELVQIRAPEVREVGLGLGENKQLDVTMRFAGDGITQGFQNVAEKIGVFRFWSTYNAWQKGSVDVLIGIWCDGPCADADPHNPYKLWGNTLGPYIFLATGVGAGVVAGRTAVTVGTRIVLQNINQIGNAVFVGQTLFNAGYAAIIKQDFKAAALDLVTLPIVYFRKIPGLGPLADEALTAVKAQVFNFVKEQVNAFAIRNPSVGRVLSGLATRMRFVEAVELNAAANALRARGYKTVQIEAVRLFRGDVTKTLRIVNQASREGGSVTWLEQGLTRAEAEAISKDPVGWAHILEDHRNQFKDALRSALGDISDEQIQDLVMGVAAHPERILLNSEGGFNLIGTLYERQIQVVTGSNGFIVTAHPL